MKNIIKYIPTAVMVLALGMTSCSSDLDVTPIDPNLNTGDKINSDNSLNKCYANFAVAGNGGANGDCDIDGLDGGTTGFIRQMFNANELTTDESICGWGDNGIAQFDYDAFDASHPMLKGYYYRLYAGISYCNQYIEEFGSKDEEKTAECRFLRALQYYILMDGWGNVPFTTKISSASPTQIKRANLYAWIESELLDIENKLSAPTTAYKEGEDGYGRVNKYTDELLLSRLYLNAEVYTGTAENTKAAEYAEKVIKNSPYKLHTTKATVSGTGNWTTSPYQELFMGDNGTNGASEESLFSIVQDGQRTTSWGSTLFLMAGSTDAKIKVDPNDTNKTGNGTTESWGGNRMKKDLVEKFFPNDDAPNNYAYQMPKAADDDRAIFDGYGRNLENTTVGTFTDGFAVCKFNNYRTAGTAGSTQFPDADFFFFRIAEAYLNYAEATARANGGATTAQGTQYINDLLNRAHATSKEKAAYSLSDICDEWSREFYFEGIRRTTLIRFGRFAGNANYNWSWKGEAANGRNIDAHLNLFAIPTSDLSANHNLVQNPGY